MKNKEMSVTTQIKKTYKRTGIAWLIICIASLFQNIPCKIICIAAFAFCAINLIQVLSAEKEMEDEMAEKNLSKAKSIAFDSIAITCCVFSILITGVDTFDLHIDYKFWIKTFFYLMMGISNTLVGVLFEKYEEELF